MLWPSACVCWDSLMLFPVFLRLSIVLSHVYIILMEKSVGVAMFGVASVWFVLCRFVRCFFFSFLCLYFPPFLLFLRFVYNASSGMHGWLHCMKHSWYLPLCLPIYARAQEIVETKWPHACSFLKRSRCWFFSQENGFPQTICARFDELYRDHDCIALQLFAAKRNYRSGRFSFVSLVPVYSVTFVVCRWCWLGCQSCQSCSLCAQKIFN